VEEQVAPDRNLWGDLILTSQWTYGLVVFLCETKSCWLTHARCEVKLVEGYLTRHKIVISSCLLTCSIKQRVNVSSTVSHINIILMHFCDASELLSSSEI